MKNEYAQNHISLFPKKSSIISKNQGSSRYATDGDASFLSHNFPSPMLSLSAISGKKISKFLPVCTGALRKKWVLEIRYFEKQIDRSKQIDVSS